MANFFKLFLIFLVSLFFSGCEKDDICPQGTLTTPRLVIDFYETNNRSVRKLVANLQAQGIGAENVINFNGVNTIQLPLKTNEFVTEYHLTINSNVDNEFNNTDIIKFNYETFDIYISRACGFKTNFNLNFTNGVEQTNPTGDAIDWIKDFEIIRSNIITEEDVHVKMYF